MKSAAMLVICSAVLLSGCWECKQWRKTEVRCICVAGFAIAEGCECAGSYVMPPYKTTTLLCEER